MSDASGVNSFIHTSPLVPPLSLSRLMVPQTAVVLLLGDPFIMFTVLMQIARRAVGVKIVSSGECVCVCVSMTSLPLP